VGTWMEVPRTSLPTRGATTFHPSIEHGQSTSETLIRTRVPSLLRIPGISISCKMCSFHDQGFSNSGGNTPVHVAATPQRVLLDTFVCVLRARQRTQNTHKRVLQLVVAAGDPPVRRYCPHCYDSRDLPGRRSRLRPLRAGTVMKICLAPGVRMNRMQKTIA
jgi:hypothetical protein